jgi:hypothetical protein
LKQFVVAAVDGQDEEVNYLVVIDLGQGRYSIVLGIFNRALRLPWQGKLPKLLGKIMLFSYKPP